MKRKRLTERTANYSDFDLDGFIKYLCDTLGVQKKDIKVISGKDKFHDYDLEILYENADIDTVTDMLVDNNEDFVFSGIFAGDYIYLTMPVLKAKIISENFDPKVSKKEDDCILIRDKNSGIGMWIDVWYDDEGYPTWEFNQDSFSLVNLRDTTLRFLQQTEGVYDAVQYIVDTNYEALEEKKSAKKSAKKCKAKKSIRKAGRLTEYFDFTGDIDAITKVMEDVFRNEKGGLFGESTHYESEVSDEDRYLTISALVDFSTPFSTGYDFSNSKIQKTVERVCLDIESEFDDDEEATNALFDLEPVVLEIAVDLKERIMYATIDMGNGLGSVEVGRCNLPKDGDEKGLRKAMKDLIDSF